MRPNRLVYVALVLVVFFLPFGAANASGYWSTSGKVDGKGNAITATGRDTAEIKGWMTFGEISKGYNVTLDEIATAFNLPKDQVTPEKELRSFESAGLSVTKLREWLSTKQTTAP